MQKAIWGRILASISAAPGGALNLRAKNLTIFLQISEGVDDATWEHHLRAGDYSAWFRNVIKDDDMAKDAADIEADKSLRPGESRKRLRETVSRRYTAPAKPITPDLFVDCCCGAGGSIPRSTARRPPQPAEALHQPGIGQTLCGCRRRS